MFTTYPTYPMLGLAARRDVRDRSPLGRRCAIRSLRRREDRTWRRAYGLI